MPKKWYSDPAVRTAIDNVDAIPDSWFRVPFRSKREALTVLLGPGWQADYLRVNVGFVLHCYLIRKLDGSATGVVIFHGFPSRWFDPAASGTAEPDHPLTGDDYEVLNEWRAGHNPNGPGAKPFRPVRVRDRRKQLRDVAVTMTTHRSFSGLVNLYANRIPVNPQAPGFVRALTDRWVAELGLAEPQSEGLRMLVALGAPQDVVALIAQHENGVGEFSSLAVTRGR